jgi:hypothetical protein
MTNAIEQTLLAAEAALASGRLWDAYECVDRLFVDTPAAVIPQIAFRAARLLLQSGRPARALSIYKKLAVHANANGALDWQRPLQEIGAPDVFLAIIPREQGLYVMPLVPLDFFKISDTANRAPLDLHVSFILKDERFFLNEAIEEFAELINLATVSEAAIQDFFVKNPSFIKGDTYDRVLSQPILERIDDGSVWIPDFMLRPVGRQLCDILEIKLPQSRFVTRRGTRRIQLAAEVHSALAQVREPRTSTNLDIGAFFTKSMDCPRISRIDWLLSVGDHNGLTSSSSEILRVSCRQRAFAHTTIYLTRLDCAFAQGNLNLHAGDR